MSEKMRYAAVLKGSEIDLKLLAHCFNTDKCRVTYGEWPSIGTGSFYMLLSEILEWEPREVRKQVQNTKGDFIDVVLDQTWTQAKETAKRLLDSMNGAARLVESQYKSVSVGSLHKFTLDGNWRGSSSTSSTGDDWRSYPMPSEKNGIADLVRLWAQEGFENEIVSTALTMYGAMPVTWTTLYLIYEIIRDDVNGDLSRFISATKLTDFTKAANNARELHLGPRHAKKTPLNQEELLSLDDGIMLVHHLLNHWLGEKIGQILTYKN